MVSYSGFTLITNSIDDRRVGSGLGNYFMCKIFAIQTLLWSMEFVILEFVIQISLEHDTISIQNRIFFAKIVNN